MLPVAAREVIVDGKLPALVVEDTAVLLGDRGTEGSGDDRGEKNIFRTLVEVVEVDAQGILEERRIHTDVEGLGGLPRQQFITHGEHQALNRDAVETVSVGPSAVGGHEIVVAHILLVTVQTVRSTEFQVADTVAVSLHEILLRHAPAQRYRREEGAVALLEELRRHIVTGGEFEIVAVVVGVSGAAEERLQRTAVFALRRELGAFRGNRTVARLVDAVHTLAGGRDVIADLRFVRPTEQSGYVVLLLERAVVIQHQLCGDESDFLRPVVCFALGVAAGRSGRDIRMGCAVVHDILVSLVGGETVLVADFTAQNGTSLQAFDDLEIGRKGTGEVFVVVFVGTTAHKAGQRRYGIAAVLIVVAEEDSVLLVAVEVVVRETDEVGEKEAFVGIRRGVDLRTGETDVCAQFQPAEFGRQVRTQVIAFYAVIGAHVVGFLVEIAGRKHVGGGFRTARNAYVVVLLECVLHGLLYGSLAVPVVVEILDFGSREERLAADVAQGLVTQDRVAVGRNGLVEDIGVFDTDFGAETDLRSHLLAAVLGRDQDDTVRGTCTVDSGRTGILQDVDRLDIVRVEVVHTACVRLGYTVDDYQRGVVTHGVHTADRDVHLVVRRVEILGLDDQVGCRTLQCLLDVGHRAVLDCLRLHGRNGRDDVAPRRRAVTYDYDFIQVARIFFERCCDGGARAYLHRYGLVAEERNLQFVVVGYARKAELAVGIGRSAVRRVRNHDCGSRDGQVVLVDDRTRDRSFGVLGCRLDSFEGSNAQKQRKRPLQPASGCHKNG